MIKNTLFTIPIKCKAWLDRKILTAVSAARTPNVKTGRGSTIKVLRILVSAISEM